MGFTYVNSVRCPECDDRISEDDEVEFLRMSESRSGSSELVACPHCGYVIGAIATASYDSLLF